MPSHNFALLVHTCDRYAFLYPGFEYFFSKYWDPSIRCNYYFATEEKETDISGFTNIRSGKGEWADRLRNLLTHQIKEDYVIYFQEDMWLHAPVNTNFFNQLFERVTVNGWDQVKLHSSDVYTTVPGDGFIDGFNIARLDNRQSGFLMSHQVTIWKREFLIKQLFPKEHPWRNERKGTKRLKKLDPLIYQIDYFAENGQPPINPNREPRLRSGYYTVSQNSVLTSRVEPYLDELAGAGPEMKAYREQLVYHYENVLTHDGKPKPMKVDVFKRIKNRIKKIWNG